MHQNSAVLHNTSQNWYIGWHVGGFKARGDRSGGLSCPCANHTTSTEDIPPAPTSAPTHERALNTKELAQLHQFMAPLETPTDTSSSFAHSGNLAIALNASSTENDDPWVIDPGTTNHMTGKSSSFSSYNLCSSKD